MISDAQPSHDATCFVIGADTLLIECTERLIEAGFQVKGVITAAPALVDWAESKDLRIVDETGDYAAALAADSFDYLFSISHLKLIPANVLAMAKKAAINFHDGPLPRYAGLNAPAWALMNHETEYGITWHVMTAGVEAGDILVQRAFEIAEGETSLSLNTKNFAAALESFEELIGQLAAGTETRTPPSTAGRQVFLRSQRPDHAAVIDFRAPAERLEALVRALSFGRYANNLGTPKIAKGASLASVQAASAVPHDGSQTPGTVVSIDEAITIKCGEGALQIRELWSLTGRELSVDEFVTQAGLTTGMSLDQLSAQTQSRLTEVNKVLAKAEPFWQTRLARLVPSQLAFGASAPGAEVRFESRPFNVPSTFAAFADEKAAGSLLAGFVAYLARTNAQERFHVNFTEDGLRSELFDLKPWLASDVPFTCAIDLDQEFDRIRKEVEGEVERVRRKKTYLRDLVGRNPLLTQNAELAAGRLVPLAITLTEDPASYRPETWAAVTFAVSPAGRVHLIHDAVAVPAEKMVRLEGQLATFLANIAEEPTKRLGDIDLLSSDERRKILLDWNRTERPVPTDGTIHRLFEAQVERTPDAEALVFEGQTLSYSELNRRANQLAQHLRRRGVGPGVLVGIYVERSVEMMVSILGTLKAGGAYVPLDPDYPHDRIAYMIADAKVPVILSQQRLSTRLPAHEAEVVKVDSDWIDIGRHDDRNLSVSSNSRDLCYVIYTSGSTGKPKGVQLEHGNVVNFFVGMDERIPHEPPGTWLAVTSLSFDISVLELFWTLCRGFKVVLFRDRAREKKTRPPVAYTREMDFGLFMWGNDDAEGRDKYKLMLEGARFFDEHGFASVWTPERHFHAFGGPYPNPSVTGAAIAAVTKNISVRSGSCVSPLHHPIRIAEEWAVVDNLTNGRVGLSFAAGWQPNDFVIRPENFKGAKQVMVEQIETVRKLWRGEEVEFKNPLGEMVPVRSLPRPVQKELPIWVTTAGNPDTYRVAGRTGANVLTHLLGQEITEVAEKIALYRQARAEAGLDPKTGIVTLMLHTYVGDDRDEVREIVRQPLKDYLGSSVNLVKNFAWAFPAFKRPKGEEAKPQDIDLSTLSEEELDAILDFAFARYFDNSGLFGTVDECLDVVDRLKGHDVDEIACLLDFGVPTELVMKSLPKIAELKHLSNESAPVDDVDYGFAAQVRRHGVTHLQCTPSMARMLLLNDENRAALAQVQHVMVGGEAFPPELAKSLTEVISGSVTNMYGPTETTIWSSTHRIEPVEGAMPPIPIGTPLANTQLYVLDQHRQPVPVGVAGELYIGGLGVARGYLERPELTAERFVSNPFSSDASRMYRTGDLVKWRADGVLEFLGRIDHQVKIRGYRIELGEIEARILEDAQIRECVCIVREDVPGDQRLVAYLVSKGGVVDTTAVRDRIKKVLPEFMVPAAVVAMPRMPLTANGKIDRKQLPPPEQLQSSQPKVEHVAPESDLESQLVDIWKQTLGLERVGVEDNFFDIGGHSLLVVRMHRKLQEVVPNPVSLTDLFRFPTIRSFSNYLNEGSSETVQQAADRGNKRLEMMKRRRRPRA